jgi:CheY-like chemotaxis protein
MKTLRKLLVIDDDPVVGKSFDRVLSGRGYAVVTASNGAEALRKIAAEDYDAVFTDIRMPGMDGIEVAEQIKARQPWLPVVIVSGYATAENEARAKAAGVFAVLHKPLSPKMIEDSARDVLLEGEMPVVRSPLPAPAPLVTREPTVAPAPATSFWKGLGLVLSAPLLGLAYVVALPFALVGVMAWYGARAVAQWVRHVGGMKRWLRNVALFMAAPILGLAYALALPFVLLGTFAWAGIKAVRKPAETA